MFPVGLQHQAAGRHAGDHPRADGLGLLALSKLRVNQIPDVEQPVLVVNVAIPGASPESSSAR